MKKLLLILTTALTAGHAATISVNFASDLVSEANSLTGANVAVVADLHWATPPAGAFWVSYANTGAGPGSFSPANSTTVPLAIFSEYFTLPFSGNTGSVRIWADDTANLFLDGLQVGPPANFTQGICAIGPLGCEPGEFVDVSLNGLSSGSHTLAVAAYQVGSGPFGVMYSGLVQSQDRPRSDTPEPSTWILMALGAGALALARWRKRKG